MGTGFDVYLPSCVADDVHPVPEEIPEVVSGGKETILLVEDDRSVGKVTSDFLGRCGYTVIQQTPMEDTIIAMEAADMQIDLLVVAVVNPEMTGNDQALQLGLKRPGARALIITDYPATISEQDVLHAPAISFIRKPYSLPQFARKIREILDV
ncbi:MAG: response regulator transcription factor [Chlorobiaceae bacterium]|nr:response regulator transcription factor [Chlorobiaceae bacterium]